jgi:hypothetical protein
MFVIASSYLLDENNVGTKSKITIIYITMLYIKIIKHEKWHIKNN